MRRVYPRNAADKLFVCNVHVICYITPSHHHSMAATDQLFFGMKCWWFDGVLLRWCDQSGVAPPRSLTSAVTQSPRHCRPLFDKWISDRSIDFSVWAAHIAAGTRHNCQGGSRGWALCGGEGACGWRSIACFPSPLLRFAQLPVKLTCPGPVGRLKVNSRWCYGQIGTRVWTGVGGAVTYRSRLTFLTGAVRSVRRKSRTESWFLANNRLGTQKFQRNTLLFARRTGRFLREERGVW